MNKIPDPKSYAFFLATWQVYRKIVDGNYMYHREIFSEIQKILGERAKGQPTILDLGCGDARTIYPVLEKIPFSKYTGVDASQPALKLAKGELKAFGNRVEFLCIDMLEFLKESPSRAFDVILVSFSLHHLNSAQKGDFLALCKKQLRPSGMLIVVDVFRDEGQDREDYLDAYCKDMSRRWTTLTQAEGQIAMEHVRTHDFPESLEDFLTLGKAVGLSLQRQNLRYGFHVITTFAAETPYRAASFL